jgi:hypothetical protein
MPALLKFRVVCNAPVSITRENSGGHKFLYERQNLPMRAPNINFPQGKREKLEAPYDAVVDYRK